MRLLLFTFLAIAIGTGVQIGLGEVPSAMAVTIHQLIVAMIFVLPMIATAALAYAMRIPNAIYVYFLVILSPFVSAMSMFFIDVYILHQRMYFW